MNRDLLFLVAAWVIGIVALIVFVPRNRVREAWVIFLFKQFIAIPTAIVVSHFDLIEYPVRLFPDVYKSSFTFDFFVFPAICVFFNLYYPELKSRKVKALYYAAYPTIITAIEFVVERCTNIISYVHWTLFTTWITVLITFLISRLFYVWFYGRNSATQKARAKG